MKVFLIGFMASGKSTVGEELANVLGYKFVDLDTYIEKKYKKSVKLMFEINGEDYFRRVENEALVDVSQIDDNIIVASGGGTSCFYNSVEFMNKVGLTIYLRVEVSELLSRLIESKKDRPLLWGKSKEELNNYIIRVLDERKRYYEKAKITVQMDKVNINQLANTIRSLSL
ncbi:MAG: shikimate kinase [Bacteroidales bacterium]|nr:shikimate kinase [Bacteroidales bacterium]MDD4384764.1 shikimate kinase [Bacteroidales bacterium]MDY0198060.1 shikimate kinase [Tenuifilaceae bacterium]